MINGSMLYSQKSDLLKKISSHDTELTEKFSSKFSTTPFLSRKVVSFQGNKDKPIYSWYKYKEAFSLGLVANFLSVYEGGIQGKVLDPFAGIGTTLFGAKEFNINADGIELLPIGQEIIETRLLIQNGLSTEDIECINRWILTTPWKNYPKRIAFNTYRITEGAYPSETVEEIERYRGAMKEENKIIQAFLRLALLCILESISFTRKDGQYLRWDQRSGRMRHGTKPFNKGEILNFQSAIKTKLREILSDITFKNTDPKLFPNDKVQSDIRLFKGSCLEILQTLPTNEYDAIITSPPYCNRYDYTRTYALELAMLGITQNELSYLRQEMLTCTVENREKDLLRMCPYWGTFIEAAKNQSLLKLIDTYLEHEKIDGSLNNNSIPRMVRGYFSEMVCVIGECQRLLKPDARLIMVNDNVRYAGLSIPVDLILSDIAEMLGFDVEKILIVPGKKGNSSQQMGSFGRIPLRKCVYVWRKK